MIGALGFDAERRRFESHSDRDWKTPAVYLIIVGEGLRQRKERIGHRLLYAVDEAMIGL